jgi:colicin import membrane protein
MRLNARFWRNVTLIALVHVGALIALLRWAGASKIASAQEITWLNTGGEASATADSPETKETPTPEPERKPSPPEENQLEPVPAKSDIQMPAATPQLSPTPSAVAKPSPKPSPKSSPKKKASPKPSATPEKKKSHPAATPKREKENAKKLAAKKGEPKKSQSKLSEKTGGSGTAGGQTGASAGSANANWYGNMLHDRFYREWAQPTTVVASGAKLSALAKIRIEKDGRISDFKIVRSSGNVVVDESVEAVGRKVTRVDALPAGIGNGRHYDVNINFALNSSN